MPPARELRRSRLVVSPTFARPLIGPGYGELRGFGQRSLRLARREHRERVDRTSGILAGTLDRVGERPAVLEQVRRTDEIFVGDKLTADRGAPKGAVVGVAAGISEDHRKRHLAIAEVVADT